MAKLEGAEPVDERRLTELLNHLGSSYYEMGDSSRAVELHERALSLAERAFGAEHVLVAVALTGLGDAHGALGDANRQCELLERVLSIVERRFGAGHISVVSTLAGLSTAYSRLGDLHRARFDDNTSIREALHRSFRRRSSRTCSCYGRRVTPNASVGSRSS